MLNFGTESDDTNLVISEKIRSAMKESIKDIVSILSNGIADGESVKDWDAKKFAI